MNNNNRHSPLHLPRRALTFAVAVALFSSQSHAAPSGAEVVGGSATFTQSSTTHFIHQETDRVAINWQSFNIDAGEKVQFVQPSSQSLALNRVIGNDASQIMGRLGANGHIILVNPHGIVFSKDARVNVNGLVASGLDINPQDFINGGLAFKLTEGTDGVVINRGLIKAASGGNLALLGKRVINENMITAELGTVTLAAGHEAILTFDPDGMLGVRITKDVQQRELGLVPAVLNSGTINAISGRVLLTANVSSEVFSQAVNAGDLSSKTQVLVHTDGSFTLGRGANLVNSGTIDVSSLDVPKGTGDLVLDAGQVVMLGEDVLHTGTARANVPEPDWFSYPEGNPDSGKVVMVGASRLRIMGDGSVEAMSRSGAGADVTLLGQHIRLHERAAVSAGGGDTMGQITVGGRGGSLPSRLLDTRTVEIGTNAHLLVSGPAKNSPIDQRGDINVWSTQSTVVKGLLELAHHMYAEASIHVESEGTLGFTGRSYLSGVMFRPYPGRLKLKGRDLLVTPEGSNTTISEQSLQNAYWSGPVVMQADHSLTIGTEQETLYVGPTSGVGEWGHNFTLHAGESINLINTVISAHLSEIELIAGIPTAAPRPLAADGEYGIFITDSQLLSNRSTSLYSFAGIHAHNLYFNGPNHRSSPRAVMTAETQIDVSLGQYAYEGVTNHSYWNLGNIYAFVQPDQTDLVTPVLRESLVFNNPFIRIRSAAEEDSELHFAGNFTAVARNIRGGGATHVDLSGLVLSTASDRFSSHPRHIRLEADTLAEIPQIGRGLPSGNGFTPSVNVNFIAHQGDIIHRSPVYTGGGNYFARAGGDVVFSPEPEYDNSVLYLGRVDSSPGDASGKADVSSGGDIYLTIGTPVFVINTNGQPANIRTAY